MATLYVANGYVADQYVQDGISIQWATGVIFVPLIAMVLIQSTPTTIYELDLDVFRRTLKDLEDDQDGIVYTKTHNHNTTVEVGGVPLARVIEILTPYTVTFENGSYAVNLTGANSNVGDVVNVNEVSVRSANSAGLIDLASMQATIDLIYDNTAPEVLPDRTDRTG